ncbi:hypothetical protein A3A39_02820 [Candidatus Kaiserbacteria bacterium RIFCSPLOWO2_01_FULL_54_13]|uniref:Uncharacterized protein n=1 Tax=Candidatus Kaiserbacteria bacterium RIFCSPLOWO2_01_FULL_54_13 TaxID=1798512 RepID=A0A1F6F2V8_9BACT|nr:MAG: hypothetical protein A3A39_02820 [Candidatus Kaiserbacteria bacterium RIFCSPLOWO2_01_FULL_54_13]
MTNVPHDGDRLDVDAFDVALATCIRIAPDAKRFLEEVTNAEKSIRRQPGGKFKRTQETVEAEAILRGLRNDSDVIALLDHIRGRFDPH